MEDEGIAVSSTHSLILRSLNVPTNLLYHYTSIQTLISILKYKDKEGHRYLWLSDVLYLNDYKEVKDGLDLLENRIEERKYELDSRGYYKLLSIFFRNLSMLDNLHMGIYVMSLSEKKDSLNQWRSYTPHEKGLSVGFDFSDCSGFLDKAGLKLFKCIYDQENKIKLIDDLIEHFLQGFDAVDVEDSSAFYSKVLKGGELSFFWRSSMSTFYLFLSIIKNQAFEEEQEWRLISIGGKQGYSELNYREGASMLIPYLKVPIKLEEYFAELLLGPTSSEDLSRRAVKGLLEKNLLSDVILNVSKIPYREW